MSFGCALGKTWRQVLVCRSDTRRSLSVLRGEKERGCEIRWRSEQNETEWKTARGANSERVRRANGWGGEKVYPSKERSQRQGRPRGRAREVREGERGTSERASEG
eukprot:6194349-Pleurochrysis_carterae.AAC.1